MRHQGAALIQTIQTLAKTARSEYLRNTYNLGTPELQLKTILRIKTSPELGSLTGQPKIVNKKRVMFCFRIEIIPESKPL